MALVDGEERREKLQWFAACHPSWENTSKANSNDVFSLDQASADYSSPFGISVLAEGVDPVVE